MKLKLLGKDINGYNITFVSSGWVHVLILPEIPFIELCSYENERLLWSAAMGMRLEILLFNYHYFYSILAWWNYVYRIYKTDEKKKEEQSKFNSWVCIISWSCEEKLSFLGSTRSHITIHIPRILPQNPTVRRGIYHNNNDKTYFRKIYTRIYVCMYVTEFRESNRDDDRNTQTTHNDPCTLTPRHLTSLAKPRALLRQHAQGSHLISIELVLYPFFPFLCLLHGTYKYTIIIRIYSFIYGI